MAPAEDEQGSRAARSKFEPRTPNLELRTANSNLNTNSERGTPNVERPSCPCRQRQDAIDDHRRRIGPRQSARCRAHLTPRGRIGRERENLRREAIAGQIPLLEHPRRGFSYADRNQVDAQLARLRDLVLRHRDDPALLLWGIGNEVEAELADTSAVWPAIDEAARLVKSLDPAHPTLAVLGETGRDHVTRLRRAAPGIDVLGVNSYGDGLLTLAARVRAQGWSGPLIVTELGALGQWQAAKTPWGAAIEPTSTEKAARLRRYLAALAPETGGQLLFLWGHKQEVTPTWHSLLLPGGEWIEASEVMAEAWRGTTPGGNRAPRIAGLRLTAPDRAELDAIDPDGDALSVEWRLLEESTDLRKAGDAEAVPPDRSAALHEAGMRGVRVGPLGRGNYRLFVTVRDGRGAAATGNLPFQR